MEDPRPMTTMEQRATEWLRLHPDMAATIGQRSADAKSGQNLIGISRCDRIVVHSDVLEESDVVFGAWLRQD